MTLSHLVHLAYCSTATVIYVIQNIFCLVSGGEILGEVCLPANIDYIATVILGTPVPSGQELLLDSVSVAYIYYITLYLFIISVCLLHGHTVSYMVPFYNKIM